MGKYDKILLGQFPDWLTLGITGRKEYMRIFKEHYQFCLEAKPLVT